MQLVVLYHAAVHGIIPNELACYNPVFFFLRVDNEESKNKYGSITVLLFGFIVNFFSRFLKKFIG